MGRVATARQCAARAGADTPPARMDRAAQHAPRATRTLLSPRPAPRVTLFRSFRSLSPCHPQAYTSEIDFTSGEVARGTLSRRRRAALRCPTPTLEVAGRCSVSASRASPSSVASSASASCGDRSRARGVGAMGPAIKPLRP